MCLKLALAILTAFIVACARPDLTTQFRAIAIGDSHASTVAALGPPSSTTTTEILGIQAETLTWTSGANMCSTTLAYDKVVAKVCHTRM